MTTSARRARYSLSDPLPQTSGYGEAQDGAERSPLLIVGMPRAGTSFMVTALIEDGGFVGHSEGHALSLFSALRDVIYGFMADMSARGLRGEPGNAVHYLDPLALDDSVTSQTRDFASQIYGNARWLDKSPSVEGIWCLPDVLRVWPRAKVLCMLRGAVGNSRSAERYFGVSFADACANWANCLEAWTEVKSFLPPGSLLEVEHEDIAEQPAATAREIAQFLAMSDADSERFVSRVTSETGAWSSGRGSAEPTLDSLTSQEAALLAAICGRQMLERGECDADWLAAALESTPAIRAIPVDAVKPYHVQASDLFVAQGNRLMIHPGDGEPSIFGIPVLRTDSYSQFACEFSLDNAQANAVLFCIQICDTWSGDVLASESIVLDAGGVSEVVLDLPAEPVSPGGAMISIIVQTTMEDPGAVNHFAWAHISNMQLRRNHWAGMSDETGTEAGD